MMRKPRSRRFITLTVAYAILFLACDFALTNLLWSRLYPETAYRVADPLFHHTFKANYRTDQALWGDRRYPVRTNSLGFKDADVRAIAKPSGPKRRVVFIGDSFAEGIGMSFEESFVGRFAQHLPRLEILNAAVGSYSPSIYWRKIKWLLAEGYAFDELVVYVDISDVQDEAVFYGEDAQGRIVERTAEIGLVPEHAGAVGVPPPQEPRFIDQKTRDWLKTHFFYSNVLFNMLRSAVTRGGSAEALPREAPHRTFRSYWTIDPTVPGYGAAGVEGGIAKTLHYMDRLKALLDEHHVELSVAVYPWPDQLDYDVAESRQVVIWRDWCERQHCRRFINHFPELFRHKSDHADWRETLFIPGDIHYGVAGNRLLADRLILSLGDGGE